MRSWTVLNVRFIRSRSSTSGTSSPTWEWAWASADPPRRRLPLAISTKINLPPDCESFRSGVTVRVTSGHPTYALMTREPGPFTASPSACAAIERLSFPPSIAIPRLTIASRIEIAARYSSAPSPSIFAAHIQFPEALISSIEVIFAQTMLVRASATAKRPMASQLTKPLIGCSPIEKAVPVVARTEDEITPTSEIGSWRGPTHCCWATWPVTERSTLVVRNRLLHTPGSASTLWRRSRGVLSVGKVTGISCFSTVFK
mmetsp:Transcript_2638/g.2955  ORF Transcript_2638/g.2955 Transcript_2638/m.2955 type:complete len:258 (-) Transcript_2638:2315-3088(-)